VDSKVPEADWLPGFRAGEMPRRVLYRIKMIDLLSKDWLLFNEFASCVAQLQLCVPEEKAAFIAAARVFFDTAKAKQVHWNSWQQQQSLFYNGLSDSDKDFAQVVAQCIHQNPDLLPPNVKANVLLKNDVLRLALGENRLLLPKLLHFLEQYVWCRPTTTHRVEAAISNLAPIKHGKPQLSDFRASADHRDQVNLVQLTHASTSPTKKFRTTKHSVEAILRNSRTRAKLAKPLLLRQGAFNVSEPSSFEIERRLRMVELNKRRHEKNMQSKRRKLAKNCTDTEARVLRVLVKENANQ
jgi:hypothetical protein